MTRLRCSACLLAIGLWAAPLAWSGEIPAEVLDRLRSEEFQSRQQAQSELLAWARQQPGQGMDVLFVQSRTAGDPEVRERCLAVLRELVGEEYLREGEGYMGIRMQDEIAEIPGEARPRPVIRVIQVVPESAADAAGLRLNDLIAGLDGQRWPEGPVSIPFREAIRQFKPNDKVTLKVVREGKLIDAVVKLGRRPAGADMPFLDASDEEMQAVEQAAREGYFRRWLERKKSGK